MASNEEVLLQFSAQDEVSSVISEMESSISASMSAIAQAMSNLDSSLNNLSSTAGNVATAFGEMESSFSSASTGASNFQSSVSSISSENLEKVASDVGNVGSAFESASAQADGFSSSVSGIEGGSMSVETPEVSGESGGELMDSASALYVANQLSTTGAKAEVMANGLNEARVSLSQLSTMTGVAEPQLQSVINDITNASFSHEDAFMYIKNLRQMQVDTENYGKSASDINAINEAFGLGARTTNSLATEMGVLGVDMNNVSSSFNALAYANENTKGGMENFFTFFRKYDSQLHEMGFSMDQTALIISGATQKYGGGRAALTGLSTALKDSGGDARALEQALDLQSGSLDNATQITGQYEGKLEELASAESKNKTLSQQLGAMWADLSFSLAPVIAPLTSFMGLIGQAGSFALSVNALKDLGKSFRDFANDGGISGAISKLKSFGKAKDVSTGASGAGGIAGVGKNTSTVAKEAGATVKGATGAGNLAGPANAAGANMKATNVGLRSIGSGALSMVAPLLEIAVAVAILLPVLAALAAEALLLLKGLQLLIDALGFDKVDLTGAIEGIKQVGRALLELGIAMAELTFANIMTGLGVLTSGVTGLINPIQVAGTMLLQAAQELQVFNQVKIDEAVPTNLKSISQALKSVSDAMNSLVNVVLTMAMGNLATLGGLLGNVTTAVRTAKTEITNAAYEIDTLKSLPDLDEGATEKLRKVSSSLESVAKAMESLRSIRDGQNWDNLFSGLTDLFGGVDISGAISGIKNDLYKVSAELAVFKDMSNVPEGVGEKLQKVSSALESLAKAVESMKTIKDQYNWDNGMLGGLFQDWDIIGAIRGIKTDIFRVSAELRTLKDISNIPEGVTEKLKKVSSTLKAVVKTIDSMKQVSESGEDNGGGANFDKMITSIQNARTAMYRVSASLRTLKDISEIPEGTDEKIKAVSRTTKSVSTAVKRLVGVPDVDVGEVPQRVQKGVTVIRSSARQMNGLKSVQSIGEEVTTKVSGVGKGARALRSAINPLKSFPVVSGDEIPNRVQKAVTAVKATAKQLNGLKGTQGVGGISEVLSSVSSAVRKLRSTLNAMRGGFRSSGVGIGSSLKGGIKQGMNGLGATISGSVRSASGSGRAMGGTGGRGIGTAMVNGFKTTFKISTVINNEMTYSLQAIQNNQAGLVGAIGSLAQAMVDEAKSKFDQQSPGKIARMMGAEMDYGTQLINSRGAYTVNATRNMAQRIVSAFNPQLNNPLESMNTAMSLNRLTAVRNMSRGSDMGKQQRPVSIHIGEGAVQLDARNMTTTESRQLMINALEGLDVVNGVDVRGV